MGQIETFTYQPEMPDRRKRGKSYFDLAKSDTVKVEVQIVGDGGANRLHSHPYIDGTWYVLRGRGRFYDADDQPIEVGVNEGVFVPHGTRYRFEAAGDEPMHLFYVAAKIPNADRVKGAHTEYHQQEYPTPGPPDLEKAPGQPNS